MNLAVSPPPAIGRNLAPSATRATRDQQRQTLADQQAAKAKRARLNRFVLPVRGYQLTAGFGEISRLWATVHTGLDFAAPSGTRVVAVERGRVLDTGWSGAFGLRVVVAHPDGTQTWYCHLSRILVSRGVVPAGGAIGLVGSTGNTTGPHLHLEVHPRGGDAVDPYAWLVKHGLHP